MKPTDEDVLVSKEVDDALKVAGGIAIVAGIAAVVVFGPAAVGGAIAGVGVKLAAIGGSMVKEDILEPSGR